MTVLEQRPVEVLDSAPSVEELEKVLRAEHESCIGTLRKGMDHALRAGDALLAIRARLIPTKEWTTWINGADFISRKQAYTYMRLATYRDLLPEGSTVRDGEEFLKGLPALGSDKGRARIPDPAKADARRMRDEGLGYKEIAKRLGISSSTVYNWFKPASREHARRAREALKKQKFQAAIKHAVKKTGGAVAEAYSMSERMDDVLGQAHREAEDQEARRELAKAHEYLRAMRDSVVRALGVES